MTERDLLRDLEFAVGRMLSDEVEPDLWYDQVRDAYNRIMIFRMERKHDYFRNKTPVRSQ